MNDKVAARHLCRRAMVYVRQSSVHQVVHNPESRRLQYEMKQRLESLGWSEVEIVDEDLGRSATSTLGRSGFQRMDPPLRPLASRWRHAQASARLPPRARSSRSGQAAVVLRARAAARAST
jgi:hypothetical protein